MLNAVSTLHAWVHFNSVTYDQLKIIIRACISIYSLNQSKQADYNANGSISAAVPHLNSGIDAEYPDLAVIYEICIGVQAAIVAEVVY